MKLIVDQRYLSLLLSELANAPLPIEISRFVAQPKNGSSKKQPGLRKNQADDGSPIRTIVDSYDMDVLIEGKVNFYKAPDDRLLGITKATR